MRDNVVFEGVRFMLMKAYFSVFAAAAPRSVFQSSFCKVLQHVFISANLSVRSTCPRPTGAFRFPQSAWFAASRTACDTC